MASLNSLSERLRAARTASGYSVETAARMLDVKPKEIEAWESGRTRPDSNELSLLAKLYSVELSSLTEESDTQGKPPETDYGASDPTPKKANSETSAPRERSDMHRSHTFSEYLEDGEELLWEGRPAPRWKYAKKYAARMLSALAPIPIFLLLTAADEIAPQALPLIFTVFLCYAGYLEGITLVLRLGTRYAVTSRRVLILSGIPKHRCLEYRYESNDYPRLYPERNGYGSIFFRSADLRSAREANREIDENESYGEVFVNRHRRKGWKMPPDPTRNLVGVENAEALYRTLSHNFDKAHPLDRESAPPDEGIDP